MLARSILGNRVMWAISLALFLAGPFCSDGQVNYSEELKPDLTRIETLAASHDLAALEAAARLDGPKWRTKDPQTWLTYMRSVCRLLSSSQIGDPSIQALALGRFAMIVLDAGNLSIADNAQFVEFLTRDPQVIDEMPWRELRKQKSDFWLRAWQRVERSIDPQFDFSDLPSLNVTPPRATGLPAGAAPSAIADARLRSDYEMALSQNDQKIKKYNDQHWLKLNARAFESEAERYLVNAYNRPPADARELTELLSRYIDNESVRTRVLDKVQK